MRACVKEFSLLGRFLGARGVNPSIWTIDGVCEVFGAFARTRANIYFVLAKPKTPSNPCGRWRGVTRGTVSLFSPASVIPGVV